MLEHEFDKHAQELKELKASTEYYLTKYREKVQELKSLDIQIENDTKGVTYYFPVTIIKYVGILQCKI